MEDVDKIIEVVSQLAHCLEEARLTYGLPVMMTALVYTAGRVVKGMGAREMWQRQFDELMEGE